MAKASLKWGRQIQISKPTALGLAFILLPMFLVLIIASSPTTAAQQATGPEPDAPVLGNGGGKLDHGSGGIGPLRAA